MEGGKIREKFLEYFKSKRHAIVPSSSLIPEDSSVLLTTAGMQQFKKYYTGELNAERDFGVKNTASVQKCFRASDIDEVGDESHLTFFEMLGNFSFGGYFKPEAIKYAHEFITKVMKLEIDYVTVFDPREVPEGDWRKGVLKDMDSERIWEDLGIPKEKIKTEGIDVFWGPTGNEGPCGPTTEIYVKNLEGRPIEIWNIVFNEFYCDPSRALKKLEIPGIDTGMGLDRLTMVSENVATVFDTDLFTFLTNQLNKDLPSSIKRIISDHVRAIAFLISDGVRPSNKEAGYILRRLIRRVITYAYQENIKTSPEELLRSVASHYKEFSDYGNLDADVIEAVYKEEYEKFIKTLEIGIKELKKLPEVDSRTAFKLYESFGLPYEVIKEFDGGMRSRNLSREEFDEEFKRHQELSRAGQEKKFGGHGLILNTGELKAGSEEELKKVLRLHTATHLLHESLRRVLGDTVSQRGSDITSERTRFDFTFSRKLTSEEIKKVEDIANKAVEDDLVVTYEEMPKEKAIGTGALHFFKEKYPEVVKVYYVAPKGKGIKEAFSKEFCGGPHVTHTGEIGKIKILKEEAVSAGVRRIRATVS